MQESFKKHTKEAWINAVKKELPEGKTLEDIAISNNFYRHDGFPFPDDKKGFGLLPHDEWKITASFDSPKNENNT